MVRNTAVMYNSVPSGWPEEGKDLTIEESDFDLDAEPPADSFTTKNIYASFDPSQRGRMRDPKVWSYSPPMIPGTPLSAVNVIGKVLKSNHENWKPGDLVKLGTASTEMYSVIGPIEAKRAQAINPAPGVPLTAYMSALGMSGMTAWGGLYEIGQPKKGETIWVSAAAGAVGQVVGQAAVREGLNVIGSVGDDRKLDFIVNELGFTSGFNYKKENPADALKRLAPNGVDIFFDNVGGEQLDTALEHLNVFGRIGKNFKSVCEYSR